MIKKNTKLNVKQKWLYKSLSLFLSLFFVALLSYGQTEKKSMLFNNSNLITQDITNSNNFNFSINPEYSPTGLDEDCNQITPSNDTENGYGNLHLLEFANDIELNAEESFILDSLDFNYMVEPGLDIISADITFYDNANGEPGNEISSITELAPSSTSSIGSEFGFDIRNASFIFDDAVELEGAVNQAIYWVGIQIEYNGESSYMEVSSNMNTPNEIYYYDPDQSRWVGSSEPDANGGFDEAADGVIAFYGQCIAFDECSGQPEAGEITGEEDFEVCENGSFSLSTTGTTQATGLIFQWQQKPDSEEDWTDIEDANSSTLNMTSGITEDTDFRLKVTCEASDESDTTEAFSVGVTPASECYCIPEGTDSSKYINNFTTSDGIDNINNTNSGFSSGGYGDFTDMTLAQENTGEVSFEVDIEGGTAGFRIWVDWNNDGQFSSDEVVHQSSSYADTHSGAFTIPEEATPGEKRMRIVSHWLNSSGDIDPCETGFTYGEFEDYTLNVIELEDCDGMPTAGTPDEDEISICAENSFTVSVSDATGAANNLERKWQFSPAGEDDWTDIENSSGNTYFVEEGVNEDTDFRYVVTCDEEETNISDIIEVTLKPGTECYCTPEYSIGCSSGDRISNVSLTGESESLNNDSECSPDDYGDYTDDADIAVPDLAPGETYTLSVSTDYSAPSSESFKAWIDYDSNGLFNDDEEIAFVQGMDGSGTSEVEFTVPEQVEPGNYRLRVRLVYGSSAIIDPCGSASYGETEDYNVEIIELEDCTEPVIAGEAVESEIEVCAGLPFEIGVTGASDPANGLLRQWQSSPAGEDDWTDIEDAHSNTITINEGILDPTDYRYMVSCEDGDPVYSDIIEVDLSPGTECYCTPEYSTGCSSGDRISNVSLTGESESLNNDSECSPNDYGDYTDDADIVAPDLAPGETYTLSVSTDYSAPSSESFRAWIDYDANGLFDEDEEIAYVQGMDGSGTSEVEFTVPEQVEPGNYRLRVRLVYGGSVDIDPCGSASFGETEDYMVEILELEDCTEPVDPGNIVEPEMNVCAGSAFTIAVTDASDPANGLTRQWQSSPAGEDDWTDIEDAHSNSYVIQEGIEEPTDYRYSIVCNDGTPEYSDVIEVDLNPAIECYCTPENNSSTNYYIENVSTEGALQDIDNSTDFADNGYGDYTESDVIIVYPGQEFDFSISSSSTSMYYNVWIDLNQNGNFEDAGEHIASSDAYTSPPFTGTFEVPSDMEEGSYRVRIRSNWLGGSLDPCEDNGDGETEDYTLQVIYPECFPPINIEANFITDNSAGISWDANDETHWMVYYGEEGFDPETEGESIEVTDDPTVNLTDLDSETTYQVYVKTICGDDEESILIGPVSFTTNITPPENTRICDAIALDPNSGCVGGPYTNSGAFEEYLEPTGSCLNDFHGTNSVWFTFEAPANGLATISTDFNSTDFLTEIVVFEAPEDCEDMSTLGEEVGCADVNDDNLGFLELEGLTPGDTYYVKVAGFNNTDGEFCIEVELDETPPCPDPSNISIDEIGAEFVELSWTSNGEESEWEVAYGEPGFDPDSEAEESIIVNNLSTILTDLEPETDYEVYVRAICSVNNWSEWSNSEIFTTKEMSVDIQIFESFTYYPNPVKNQLNLKADTQIEKVEMFNLLGQKVIDIKPNVIETQISTEKLQSGVYLMKVNIDGSQKTFRVVKK